MVRPLALTELPDDAVVMFASVAPVLESTMFLLSYAPDTVAVAAKRTLNVPLALPEV